MKKATVGLFWVLLVLAGAWALPAVAAGQPNDAAGSTSPTGAPASVILVEEAEQAAQLLALALKTPSPVQSDDVGDGRKVAATSVYQYLGNLRIFSFEDTDTSVNSANSSENRALPAAGLHGAKSIFTFAADFADIGSVELDDQGLLTVTCLADKNCFSEVDRNFQDCEDPASSSCTTDEVNFTVQPDETEFDPTINTERSVGMVPIGRLADPATARNAKLAIEILARYNQAAPTAPEASYRVNVAEYSVANLREGPGTDEKLVAALPPTARGLKVWACTFITGFKAKWCRTDWGGIAGWASASGLIDEATNKPPN